MVDNETIHDLFNGLTANLERIAVALEQMVLNMEKPKRTRQDYLDEMETMG